MSELTWSGDDGFDSQGRRVAWVARCYENAAVSAAQGGKGSPAFFAPGWHWEALVSYDGNFDYVLVGSKPGRWDKKDEAKAAADSAYCAFQAGSGVSGDDASPTPDADPDEKVTGVRGHIRSLVRAWRTVYRADR